MATTVALYAVLAWVSWPSLFYPATALGDRAWIDALGQLSARGAFFHVSANWWRPGENMLFWGIAHSDALLPWRVAMLLTFVLTTAYLQYDATRRGRSYVDGFGAALAFSLTPTTLSVLCWLSAAHISLCAVGILAYVASARRVLTAETLRIPDVIAALTALLFALAFYELALFAPLAVFGYERLLVPHAQRRAKRWLYGASIACVALYLALQLQRTHILSFWTHESAFVLFANSMRYVMWNFYLWFNPFETFGVLIPDALGGHIYTLENVVGWALVGAGFGLVWLYRKTDPVTAFSGLWFAIFLVPVGTFLHFEGTPVAEHHLYIPLLGVALGGVRLLTRFLQHSIISIRNARLRVLYEATLSVVLLWSLAPLVAECKRTVMLWNDAQSVYLSTLEHYPQSTAALERLTQTLARRAPPLAPPCAPRAQPWTQLLDALLLNPTPRPAGQLIEEGRVLLRHARYAEAGSVLARALATSTTPQQQLDSGKALVQALSHTELRSHAAPLLWRLRHDHPSHAELLAIDLPALP